MVAMALACTASAGRHISFQRESEKYLNRYAIVNSVFLKVGKNVGGFI